MAGEIAGTCNRPEATPPEDTLPPAAGAELEAPRTPRWETRPDVPVADPLDPRVPGPRTLPPEGAVALHQAGPPISPFAEVWSRLVRRFAWGSDGRRTTARIEIGEGEWCGATIVVTAAAREVAVHIEAPAGAGAGAWSERLVERLRERGLELSELTIREYG
jgi:hypothetical protein